MHYNRLFTLKIVRLGSGKCLTSLAEAQRFIPSIQKKEKIYLKSINKQVEVVDNNYMDLLLNSQDVRYKVEYPEV